MTLFDPSAYSDLDYDSLKTFCSTCQKCDLAATRTQVVFGHGPVPSLIMAVGEGPGEQEDLQGRPFVGKAGQLLTKIFESAGIDREKQVYITNVVKCRPPANRTPLPSETAACKGYLMRQIHLVQPRILILLGSPAVKTVLNTPEPISKLRGQWIHTPVSYMTDSLSIMPMFHPSYLLRNPSREVDSPKWQSWQDIREVKAALDFYQSSL